MSERLAPEELYLKHGSWGNNTTIPEDEKTRIALSEPESGGEIDRAILRGEQALHHYFQERGEAPQGQWFDFNETVIFSAHEPAPWEMGLYKQREHQRKYNTKLSKSPRNIQKQFKRKPSRRLKRYFQS